MSTSNVLHHQVIRHKDPSAPWVTLVHGFGGNSKIWYKQVDEFKDHFNIISIDLPGHHPNQFIKEWEESYSFDLVAKLIIDVLDKYKITKSHFIGISLGSVIIHQLIKLYPNRVITSVLGGVVIRFNKLSKILLFYGNILKKFLPYIWIYQLFAHIMMPKKNHKLSRSIFIREAKKLGKKSFFKWFEIISNVEKTSKNINKSLVPKLYISGTEDHLFIDSLREHVKSDENADLIELPDCGHVCNIEKSSEFNKHTITYIKGASHLPNYVEMRTS
ncbi:alpha/beta hydrolase [Bacillus shivajii]|uniref:alpha/beta fold hydrolase n=1 Tax=Bacillus shivajii TaxID=1983719 RepID=UPI001CFA9A3D|nr:alpha/beta hydrolase [Bacillus shivajii]UCZ52786.1 alpha/beta hydrolase [Bacillus shivajii]